MTFETDDYIDRAGRKWFCVSDQKNKQMVCNSEGGDFTCASFRTFETWGWTPCQSQPWAAASH